MVREIPKRQDVRRLVRMKREKRKQKRLVRCWYTRNKT